MLHGAIHDGRKIGACGDAAAFSFYSTKNMVVGGDGGMVTTDDEEIANKISSLRDVGRDKDKPDVHNYIGYTSRMSTIHAAFGRVQLKYLDAWTQKRRAIAKKYREELEDVEEITLPPEQSGHYIPVWHLFVIRTKSRRDELKEFLEKKGIQCGIHYPLPVHLQPPYRERGYREGMLPDSEKWAKEVLSVPMHPNLAEDEIDYVALSIREFLGGAK
jgi:perosamine synthetase